MSAIFAILPLVLSLQFRRVDAYKQHLLTRSVQAQGAIIAAMLKPTLQHLDQHSVDQLAQLLSSLHVGGLGVRILLRPNAAPPGSGFFYYYVTTWPRMSTADMSADAHTLLATGLFQKLARACDEGFPLVQNYPSQSARREVLTSLVPVKSPAGCWVIITSSTPSQIGNAASELPYWQQPAIRLAAAIYAGMAILVVWLLLAVRGDLRRFVIQARHVGEDSLGPRFASVNRIAELSGIAAEFDRMVGFLRQSASTVREAAEETAHTLKAPIGIIAQSMETLRRHADTADAEAQRAIELVQRSLERLSHLVLVTRQLGESTANLLDIDRRPTDLSAVVRGIVADYEQSAALQGKRIGGALESGVVVMGNADLLEAAVENIIDNALGFSPPGGNVTVMLRRLRRSCELRVDDEGPGIPPDELPHLFDRHYSSRRNGDDSANGAGRHSLHFGIGLWIVGRNVSVLGGTVRAENQDHAGLRVTVVLPLAS